MSQLTSSQQYQCVGYLGASFLLTFIAFSSFQNIVSQIYDQY